jgi:glycosyltransferase involved in cell wall biosynthesis
VLDLVKISAIITTYNYSKYLKQCVDSVLNQTQSDYEIIIVDDASTDNIEEVLKQYKGRKNIRIIRHSKNQGLIKSCDEAIKESGGEYIIRLDADDYFDENALLIRGFGKKPRDWSCVFRLLQNQG